MAHNRFITHEEMRMIISKKNSIDEVINEALNAIDNIEITKKQEAEIKTELKSTIHEKTGDAVEVNNNNEEADNKYLDKKLLVDSEQNIKKLTRFIYMNIHDSYKKELRKHRSKLNRTLENYKLSPENDFFHNMLELDLSRAKEYLKTISEVI